MDTKQPKDKQSSQFAKKLRYWFKKLLQLTQLREDTDYEATIENITKSVTFRGMNLWILFFAIIVASVGLNVNSTAVIIGAMLISPLMGPINGLGLAIGIFDEDLMRKSLTNLLIMVLISLLASTLYFLISPLGDAQSELLARTNPTIFDVFIGFFGGSAGIVAMSRKNQSMTVISGVAIATALMPPLCTAGYGLATFQFRYFFGALYLFFINSFFIALSTFIFVRYLGFPQTKYMDNKRATAVKRIITVFTIIVIVPSVIGAINMIKETAFHTQAKKFVTEIQETPTFKNRQVFNVDREYNRKEQTITMSVVGTPLNSVEITELQEYMRTTYGLKNTKLIVKQTGETIDIAKQNEIIENMLDKKEQVILEKDSVIHSLQSKMSEMEQSEALSDQIAKELYVQYPNLEVFALDNLYYVNPQTGTKEKTPTVYFKWKDKAGHALAEESIIKWLKVRLEVSEIKVIH
ncbi:MAG: DUF389 domain-containing protein [Bacteroidales bacterium]|nr:DUF389 domain-containing protein [Bacteroidales bacterium]